MKGDFSRDSFHPEKHFSRVLMQQGRVQLDADWNEQVSIFLHRLQTVTRDLIGSFGGPAGRCGFAILDKDHSRTPYKNDFGIGKGRYYVGGLLCENDSLITYNAGGGHHLEDDSWYIIYLDVWEDYVSPAEDPGLSEIALSGSDTCGRARIAYLVRAHKLDARRDPKELHEAWWDDYVPLWQSDNRGMMKARTQSPGSTEESSPCVVSPDARYRGAENQLYRVEIHHAGHAARRNDARGATLKWSRENGSILFPVARVDGQRVTLKHPGRDSRLSIQIGDWVELSKSLDGSHQRPSPLFLVTAADALDITVDGLPDPAATTIRRWDQKAVPGSSGAWPLFEGSVPIREGTEESNWIQLEDGIEIQFQPPSDASRPDHYRSGDFWLIPARTANGGQVEWPADRDGPLAVGPNGIEHHYAPLAVMQLDKDGKVEAYDCRTRFSPRHEIGA